MNPENPPSDRRLLNGAIAGDGESFAALFERHRDRIFRHSFSILQDAAAAEDVTAMVFYEAWRKRTAIRIVDDSMLPWLLVTANFTIRNQNRQQRRYRHFLEQLPEPDNSPDIAEEVVERHESSGQQALIRQAFEQLNAQARDVLTLCVIEELPIKDAADLLDVPEGTVKSRLARARKKLGLLYSGNGPAAAPIIPEGSSS